MVYGMCMGTIDASIDTPHFIVMDEELGYWFLTAATSGYVAQYSLVDNHLIDSFMLEMHQLYLLLIP